MTRLLAHLDHSMPAVGLAMGSLQDVLARPSCVGITGVVLELCGRIALTAAQAAHYLRRRPAPHASANLTVHSCINLRLPTHGGIYVWEFEKAGQVLDVRVEGLLVFNNSRLMLEAAVAGLGLVFLTEGQAQPEIDAGTAGPRA